MLSPFVQQACLSRHRLIHGFGSASELDDLGLPLGAKNLEPDSAAMKESGKMATTWIALPQHGINALAVDYETL